MRGETAEWEYQETNCSVTRGGGTESEYESSSSDNGARYIQRPATAEKKKEKKKERKKLRVRERGPRWNTECGFSSNDYIAAAGAVAVTVSVHRFKFTGSPVLLPASFCCEYARGRELVKIETNQSP